MRGARFGGAGVVEESGGCRIANGNDTDLLGGEPEGEVAGVVFDEEADEALVRAERGAMDVF